MDKGIVCVEAGYRHLDLGAQDANHNCTGKLEETGAYEKYQPDVVLYDVLETLSVVDFLCRCEMGMQTRSLLLHLEKIWRFMQVRILLWR